MACVVDCIADMLKIVVVDCQPFSGSCKFSDELDKDWMQGGDNAVLIKPWFKTDTSILVCRQSALDDPGRYSGKIEEFLVKSCCMPERHVISINWVNMLAGVYQANPCVPEPSIFLWLCNRRGVPVEKDASEYQQFVASMSGPVCVHDAIHSDLSNFSSSMTNTQFATISGSGSAKRNGFEGAVLELKPNHALN